MNTKLVVRRIGVVSLAKIQGVLYALLGLIIGALFSLLALVGSAIRSESSGSGFAALFGVAAIVVFPILYGVLGFIFGLIMGGLYNLVAGMVGGVEIEGTETQLP